MVRLVLILVCLQFSACSVIGLKPDVFNEAVTLGPDREWRHYAVVKDVNADGYPDIIATQRRPNHHNALHVWLTKKEGGWDEMPQNWVTPGYSGLDVADFNHDGALDIIAGSHYNRIHIYKGVPGKPFGTFENSLLPTSDGYVAAKIIDLYGDGDPEIVMLGNERAGVEIYNWENEQLVLKNALMPGVIGRDMQIVDMNRDGRLDIVASFLKAGVVIFLQGEKSTWTQAPATNFFSETKEFKSIAIADINADGWPDIALNGGWAGTAKPNGPDVYLSKGTLGGWTESSANLKIFNKPAEGIAVADFNQDGFLDLIIGGNDQQSIKGSNFGLFLFAGDGKGNWKLDENSGLPETGLVRPFGIEAKDINLDGLVDLISLHSDPEGDAGYVSVIISNKRFVPSK